MEPYSVENADVDFAEKDGFIVEYESLSGRKYSTIVRQVGGAKMHFFGGPEGLLACAIAATTAQKGNRLAILNFSVVMEETVESNSLCRIRQYAGVASRRIHCESYGSTRFTAGGVAHPKWPVRR